MTALIASLLDPPGDDAGADDFRKTSAARDQFFQDRREAFELDNLLQVYEAVSALTRAAAGAHNDYLTNYEVSLEARQLVETANGGVVAVRHPILDDSLREKVRLAHGVLLRDGRFAGTLPVLWPAVVPNSLLNGEQDRASARLNPGMTAQRLGPEPPCRKPEHSIGIRENPECRGPRRLGRVVWNDHGRGAV
jgi:hypothetical protein